MKEIKINFKLNQLFYVPVCYTFFIASIGCLIMVAFIMLFHFNRDQVIFWLCGFCISYFICYMTADKVVFIKRSENLKTYHLVACIVTAILAVALIIYKLITGNDPTGLVFISYLAISTILVILIYNKIARIYNTKNK